ncbi:flagellar hook-associated protein FlgL [Shewanella gaetbuli]|uniref:Flagellar hook-associated protein FlgL n=1 Tax=Shewanella gaetbuli TaxID=220752 RepID=A0A9X1ZG16_9GAMM|nr:flagellar hook-associated protein FlgL [Shewanella gaetbuli]MCL1141699.1 flagellar hook-associated protein FlgL [Shewanella gaetbuli]
MRISTGQMFHQNTTNILKKQSDTNQILDHLSTGKKINTAGDDPVGAIVADNLKQQNNLVNQYIKNVDYATNRLSIAESKLGSAETLVTTMRDQFLRGANGSLSSVERQMVADEMRASLDELISIANTRDESGNYLFAGFKTNEQPFAFDNNGEVMYSGDSGVRQSVVAQGITVGSNIPGDLAFMNSPNPLGDYGVNYLSGQQGDFTLTSAKITNPAAHIEDTYTVNFVANGANIDVEVFDSSGTLTTTIANFDPATPISVNGIDITLDGNPTAGDSFTIEPQENISILDSLNQAIALLESPDSINTPDGKSKLAQLLNNIDSGQNQVSIARGVSGNSLKALESISVNHGEEQLINNSALSTLEDLDIAEAISEFEKLQLSLNAVSSVFGKVGSLSLFDYI